VADKKETVSSPDEALNEAVDNAVAVVSALNSLMVAYGVNRASRRQVMRMVVKGASQ
jgi:hypothetical protein